MMPEWQHNEWIYGYLFLLMAVTVAGMLIGRWRTWHAARRVPTIGRHRAPEGDWADQPQPHAPHTVSARTGQFRIPPYASE